MPPSSPEDDDDTSLPPDPLLKPGAFIEPETRPEPDDDDAPVAAEPLSVNRPSTLVHYSDPGENGDAAVDVPDWLPIGWLMESRVRVSGASAGHRDKYYVHEESGRRCRSKKEVMSFLETGQTKKRVADSAGGTPAENGSSGKKPRKSATKGHGSLPLMTV
ncbi:hypothetical protein Droror1_Dr00004309 [Drosera rotundifolia]